MFILSSPILTIVSILSLAFFYALVISAEKIELIRKICLSASFAALLVGILMALSFDKASTGYQCLSSFNFVSEYNSAFAIGADGLSYVFLVLTLTTFPFLFLAAWTVTKFPKQFFCHLLAMEILLVLTFVTIDLFYFFVLFESLLIPMFILIGGWGARTRKIKAAYYFFLYTLFGSLFMLFGMIYLYQVTGSLNYYVLLSEDLEIKTQKLLWWCFFLAFAVKMPLFPFHIWLPEAHVEAPTVGSMLLASLLLKLGGYGLLRFSLTLLGSASVFFTATVAMLAIAGVVYGSLSTMRQIDLKRIIAYSSVAHMNLIALGIFSFNRVGIEGAIYLMVAHGVVSAALFFCVGVLYDRTHTRLLRYYGGAVTVMPVLAAFFFLFNLANMGFPGTPNFVGELLTLAGVNMLSTLLVFPAALGVVFSSAYCITLFAKVVFGPLKTLYTCSFVDATRRDVTILFSFLGISLVLGVRSDFVLSFLEAVVWNITHFSESPQYSANFSPVPCLVVSTILGFLPNQPFLFPTTWAQADACFTNDSFIIITLLWINASALKWLYDEPTPAASCSRDFKRAHNLTLWARASSYALGFLINLLRLFCQLSTQLIAGVPAPSGPWYERELHWIELARAEQFIVHVAGVCSIFLVFYAITVAGAGLYLASKMEFSDEATGLITTWQFTSFLAVIALQSTVFIFWQELGGSG